jgi:hypothetical protein
MAAVVTLLEAAAKASPHVLVAVAVAVAAGATRQVAAAVTVAAIRSLHSPGDGVDPEVLHEVDLRVKALREDLVHKVGVVAEGGVARRSGHQRATRNVAAHVALGTGVITTQLALRHPQRAQRGRRSGRGGASTGAPSSSSGPDEPNCGIASTVPSSRCVESSVDYQQHGAESPPHGAAGAGSYDGTSPLAIRSEGRAPVAPELEDNDVEQQAKSSATVDDGSVSAGGVSASPPDSVHHDGDRTKLVLALAEAVTT